MSDANFVGAFESGEHVYVWFRETAAEAVGQAAGSVFGRVARVCKADLGGVGKNDGYWTTYAKATLKCSLNDPDAIVDFGSLRKSLIKNCGNSLYDILMYAGLAYRYLN